MLAYFRLFTGLPGMTVCDSDVSWFISDRSEPGNHILRTHITADQIEQRIDAIFTEIGQYTSVIDWLVFPGCRPVDLGKRLEARGMQGGPGGIWMTTDLTALPDESIAPDGFHIVHVNSAATLAIWQDLTTAGFGDPSTIHYEAYMRHGFGPEAIALHYIGYQNTTPVTSSTLLLAGGIAGIFDVSTPPLFRRQGFGNAITQYMLHEAHKHGYPYAWIWSSTMGQELYRKLGFVAADFGVREYHWQREG